MLLAAAQIVRSHRREHFGMLRLRVPTVDLTRVEGALHTDLNLFRLGADGNQLLRFLDNQLVADPFLAIRQFNVGHNTRVMRFLDLAR